MSRLAVISNRVMVPESKQKGVAGGLGVVIPAPGGLGSYHYLIQQGLLVLGITYMFWPDKSNEEIEEIGVFDNIYTKIILIEWPKFQKMYNVNPLILNIQFGKKVNERIFTIKYNKSWVNKIDFSK